MFFFAGLLGGRGIAAAILLQLKEVTVAVGGVLLAATGELIFLSARSHVALFGGAFLAGLGLASPLPDLYCLAFQMVVVARHEKLEA